MTINDIEIFVKIIDQNSFSGAADLLRIPKSTVSRRFALLEERLGVKLLNRTTRHISLTSIGQAYYEKCLQILNQLEEAEGLVKGLQTEPRGNLRITVPVELGQFVLKETVTEFLKIYPAIRLELDLTNRLVDLVEEGVDLALRVGSLENSSLTAVKVGSMRGGIYTSPTYFENRVIPQHPLELALEECIQFNAPGLKTWSFRGPDKEIIVVKPKGRLKINSMRYMCDATVDGLGIAAINRIVASTAMKEGKLVEILKNYELIFADVFLVYPTRKYISTNVRLFIDFLKPRLGKILSQEVS